MWYKTFKAGSISSQQHLPLPPTVWTLWQCSFREILHRTPFPFVPANELASCSPIISMKYPPKLAFLMGVKLPSSLPPSSGSLQRLTTLAQDGDLIIHLCLSLLWLTCQVSYDHPDKSLHSCVLPYSPALLPCPVTPFLLPLLFLQSNPSLRCFPSSLWSSMWSPRAHTQSHLILLQSSEDPHLQVKPRRN